MCGSLTWNGWSCLRPVATAAFMSEISSGESRAVSDKRYPLTDFIYHVIFFNSGGIFARLCFVRYGYVL